MKKPLLAAASLALGTLLALPAAAQFAKPEDAVKYRKAALNVMAAHFGRIGAVVQGRVPYDAAAVTANADIVATVSKLPYAGFVEGTASTEKGGPKANIWTERAKFDGLARKLAEETAKLEAAAKTNNLDNVKAAFGNVAGTCKSCHDDFRNP